MADEKNSFITLRQGADPLTSLHTRQDLFQALLHLANSRDAQMPTSFVLFNITGMLQYNNILSCSDGDVILQSVARIIQQHLPEGGIAGRWNGTTFGVILPFSPASISKPWAAMVAQAAGKLRLPLPLPSYLQAIHVVWGLATSPPQRLSCLPQQAENQLKEKLWQQNVSMDGIFSAQADLPYAQDLIFLLLSMKSPHIKEYTIASLYYCQALGEQLRLSQQEMIELRTAALWQDTGLLNVPLDILIKSGPITLKERDVIRQHIADSARWAKNFGVSDATLNIIRHHHEKWDGTGYPNRLAGEAIPLSSRIIKLCSSWTTLQQHLFWQKQATKENALAEINSKKGASFDPQLVELLSRIAPSLPTPDQINTLYHITTQKAAQ